MDKEKNCCNTEETLEQTECIVTFTADDGTNIDCRYIHAFERDGKKYGAFEPIDDEEAGVIILEIKNEDGDAFEYEAVEDEELLDALFDQLCDEYEALCGEDGCDGDCDCGCEGGPCHCHDEK